jgi:uncharacterized protein
VASDQITWVIKVSKFCNMRCSYCYEWEHLDDAARMSPELLRRLLVAIRDMHRTRSARAGGLPVVSTLVLHGGEPLILPVDYLRRLFDLAREIFGSDALASGAVRFGAQTNLLACKDDVVDLLVENGVALGVSCDFVPGVRLALSGLPTEQAVARNIDRLRARGVPMGGLAVLARHTAPRITEVYDFFASRRMSLRVLPLFDPPGPHADDPFTIDETSMVSALMTLLEHWIGSGAAVPVVPLAQWLQNVLRKVLGVRGALYDRRDRGDGIFIADTDGKLYGVRDAYDSARALGDLREQTMSDVLASQAHAASVARDARVLASVCGPCAYAGACDGTPATHTMAAKRGDHCPVAAACHARIERYLLDSGCDRDTLESLLAESRGDPRDGARFDLGAAMEA